MVEHTPSRQPSARVGGSLAVTDGSARRALRVRHWPHLAAPPMLRLERSAESYQDVEIFLAPGGYVSGEETAVVRALSGGPAKPTSKPPRPYQRGIHAQPTLVSNVETLAHLARAVRLGPDRIREDGLRSAPGTTLVTVTPDVGDAVLLEVPFGARSAPTIPTTSPVPASAYRGGTSSGSADEGSRRCQQVPGLRDLQRGCTQRF